MHDYTVAEVARICHEANRALQIAIGEARNPHWERLDVDLRNSTIRGVLAALDGKGPREMHEAWVAERMEQGWVHGEKLDRKKKVHPQLVAYDALPPEQKDKDRVFIAIVSVLAPHP